MNRFIVHFLCIVVLITSWTDGEIAYGQAKENSLLCFEMLQNENFSRLWFWFKVIL